MGVPNDVSPAVAQAYRLLPNMIYSSSILSLDLVNCNLVNGPTFAALLAALPSLKTLILDGIFASEDWTTCEILDSNLESLTFRQCFLTLNCGMIVLSELWKLPCLTHLDISDMCHENGNKDFFGSLILDSSLAKIVGQNKLQSFKASRCRIDVDKDLVNALASNTSLREIHVMWYYNIMPLYDFHAYKIFQTNTTLENIIGLKTGTRARYYTRLNRFRNEIVRADRASFNVLMEQLCAVANEWDGEDGYTSSDGLTQLEKHQIQHRFLIENPGIWSKVNPLKRTSMKSTRSNNTKRAKTERE